MTISLSRDQLLERITDLEKRERKMIKLNAELQLRIERSDMRYKVLKNNMKKTLNAY